MLVDSYEYQDKCGDYAWLPYIQVSHGVWVDIRNKSKNVSNKIDWEEDEPNGNDLQNCAARSMKSNKSIDWFCNVETCFFCHLKYDTHFSVKGLPANSDIETKYLLVTRQSFNNQIVFRAYHNFMVIYDKERNSWILYKESGALPKEKRLDLSKIRGIIDGNSPVGLKRWTLLEEGNITEQLILSFTMVRKLIFKLTSLVIFCKLSLV